jgi:hypothetical protein
MIQIKEKLIRLAVLFSFSAAAIFIFSCSDSTSSETGQGQIKITMVDAPADYDQINIVVDRVEVHRSSSDSTSGWFVINNNSATYNLLTLRNGASVILGNNSLDAGSYTQIRLIIGTGSNIVVNGVTYPLEIPSGEQSGLKLNHAFVIESGLLYELILDFDAEHSIVLTGNGQYKLKPVIRCVPTIISGAISGKINPISAAGYVYAISGIDTSVTIAEPITGSFKLMALLQRTYRIEVFSANPTYNDTTITNVIVVAQQNNNLGTINLSSR